MMKAKPYALVTVRMPIDLHDVLETLAVTKGETLSVVVRELVRQAAVDVRRGDSLGVSPPSSRNFK
jgi:predicted DNA-binding protein